MMIDAGDARRELFDALNAAQRRNERICDALCELDSAAFVVYCDFDDDTGAIVPESIGVEWDDEWDGERLRAAVRQLQS